jgi:hypothetical protein
MLIAVQSTSFCIYRHGTFYNDSPVSQQLERATMEVIDDNDDDQDDFDNDDGRSRISYILQW